MSDAAQPTVAPTTEPTSWISGITDAEIVGHFQTKGWDKLDATAAAVEAGKAHRAAERMLGAPADQLVRLPTRPDDEAGWRSVYQRLGAPEKPEGYDLSTIAFDDPETTTRFVEAVRATAAEMSMPKAMAERMAQSFHKFVSDKGQADRAENTAALQAEQNRLAQDWGRPEDPRYKGNMFVADRAADALGVSPEAMAKLKEGLGAADVARLFLKIGTAMGEDKFVTGSNPANQGMMSREQAVARRSELMNDGQWAQRYLAGGKPELREMTALNTLIAEGPM